MRAAGDEDHILAGMRELRAKVSTRTAGAEDRDTHPKLPAKPAKTVDQRIDACETQQPPQHRLGRSDDRFADPRLKLADERGASGN
jgi:hypothetical protein